MNRDALKSSLQKLAADPRGRDAEPIPPGVYDCTQEQFGIRQSIAMLAHCDALVGADTHPSWQKLRLIKERLPQFRAILWLDADTVVTLPSQSVETLIGDHQGLIVSTDWTWPSPEDEIKHFSLGNFVFTNCPGSVKIVDAALARDEWENRALWEQQAIQEEYRANTSIRGHVSVRPRRALNAVPVTPATTGPEPWEPGDFLCHMTYLSNAVRAAMFPQFDLAGIQSLLKPAAPPWHEYGMCADLRHIACLREIATCTQWRSALEIGVWQGASTVAFLAGLEASTIEAFAACDVGFQVEFSNVIEGFPVELLHMRSWQALDGEADYDLIFLDGDHSLETGVGELERLIHRQPRCILAHDVNAVAAGFGGCDGPAHIMQGLKADGYTVIVDQKQRPGEMTHRGLMAATKDPVLVPALQRCFDLTCY